MSTGIKRLKRYNKFSDFLKERFGEKVYRITVDGGFTCPNRDGKKGNTPCLYCDERGSGARHIDINLNLKNQYLKGRKIVKEKLKINKFIPYFQSFTNTYADFKTCVERYETVLNLPDSVGIAIGTRPDCVEDKLLDYLGELSKEKLVIIDLGIQSTTDRVLEIIKRGHTVKDTIDFLKRTEKYPTLHIVAHLIFGLPTETRDEMLNSARLFSDYKLNGVKFHQLNILKNTEIEKLYDKGELKAIELDFYVNLVADFLERIPFRVVVHRLSARADNHSTLIAPEWGKYHHKPATLIEKELEKRDSYQGKLIDKKI